MLSYLRAMRETNERRRKRRSKRVLIVFLTHREREKSSSSYKKAKPLDSRRILSLYAHSGCFLMLDCQQTWALLTSTPTGRTRSSTGPSLDLLCRTVLQSIFPTLCALSSSFSIRDTHLLRPASTRRASHNTVAPLAAYAWGCVDAWLSTMGETHSRGSPAIGHLATFIVFALLNTRSI
jgi:hypothetical protein